MYGLKSRLLTAAATRGGSLATQQLQGTALLLNGGSAAQWRHMASALLNLLIDSIWHCSAAQRLREHWRLPPL